MHMDHKKKNHFTVAQIFHSVIAQGAAFSDDITSRHYPIDFSKIMLIRAESTKAKSLWNKVVAKYHYLGYTGTVGRYIRYFICDCSKLPEFSSENDAHHEFHEYINQYTTRELNEFLNFRKVEDFSEFNISDISKSQIGALLRFRWLFEKNNIKSTKEKRDFFLPILGCISAGSATYSCSPRDFLLGIHELQRRERDKYLKYVANNWRFLILGHWHNLASFVLSKFSKVLQHDWIKRYDNPLVAIESFIVKNRFDGRSYIANRWLKIGETMGYSKSGSISKNRLSVYSHGEKKYIYIKLLSKFSTNNDPILIDIKRRNKRIMQYVKKTNTLSDILDLL